MADKGANLDLRYTSFYQGLVSGTGKQDFSYGGKFDALINFDSGKMGLWEGGGFHSHLEYSHGALGTNLGGAIFTTNTALYWPVKTAEELVATSLYLSQKVGDRSTIALGKFNPVDLIAQDPFFGGWGIDRFWNINFEFKHNLQEDNTQPNAAWGFYLKAAVADGNPNYVQRSLVAGISGRTFWTPQPSSVTNRASRSSTIGQSRHGSTSGRTSSTSDQPQAISRTPWSWA